MAEQLDERADKYLDFISKGSERMKVLVRDLLTYAKLDQIELEDPVDLNKVVSHSLGSLSVGIEESNAKVEFKELPTVLGNKSKLQQVFQNLIGNAIKYRSSKRDCQINITGEELDTHWEISIADNGLGIRKTDLPIVFDVFRRVHLDGHQDGTGIGLAICKKTIEKHGGRIWAESDGKSGTTFKFTMPKI